MLSGTPVLSRPREIYTVASALRPSIFGKFRGFQERHGGDHSEGRARRGGLMWLQIWFTDVFTDVFGLGEAG
jgi:hypothetical protein